VERNGECGEKALVPAEQSGTGAERNGHRLSENEQTSPPCSVRASENGERRCGHRTVVARVRKVTTKFESSKENPKVNTTSWSLAEEQLIAEAMVEGLGRIEAIRRLRSSWQIGETPPPMSREGRKMPKENPRYVGDASQDGSKSGQPAENVHGLFLASPGIAFQTNTTRKRGRPPVSEEWKRDMANGRKSRWRAKRKEAAAVASRAGRMSRC
jgi:hypothetical protein